MASPPRPLAATPPRRRHLPTVTTRTAPVAAVTASTSLPARSSDRYLRYPSQKPLLGRYPSQKPLLGHTDSRSSDRYLRWGGIRGDSAAGGARWRVTALACHRAGVSGRVCHGGDRYTRHVLRQHGGRWRAPRVAGRGASRAGSGSGTGIGRRGRRARVQRATRRRRWPWPAACGHALKSMPPPPCRLTGPPALLALRLPRPRRPRQARWRVRQAMGQATLAPRRR